MLIAACVKWVRLRSEVDPVHGTVTAVAHAGGFSDADLSAVEVALRLADAWGAETAVVCAGPADAEDALRDLVASGVSRAIRIDAVGGGHGSLGLGAGVGEAAAAQLAAVLSTDGLSADGLGADVVVCGDVSVDIGSGTVPGYLAHHLGTAQALGLIEVAPGPAGSIRALRRLDGGRREVLEVSCPAVISVEGGVAELRRAGLAATLAARDAVVELRGGVRTGSAVTADRTEPPRLRPWRPPGRAIPAPDGAHALDRIVALTGALVDRTPPRTVGADPAEAAEVILEQLRAWGYLPGA